MSFEEIPNASNLVMFYFYPLVDKNVEKPIY